MEKGQANILIVDDEPANLLALRAVLEPLGHTLLAASSGREALRRLLSDEVAIIILDVQMPEFDGFETARHIRGREMNRHTPIIFLTAHTRDEARLEQGYAQGALDFVSKPFNPDILRAKVAALVELYLHGERLKQREALLRAKERSANEALVRRLMEMNLMALVFSDPQGRILSANDAFLQMMGSTQAAVEKGSLHWRDILPEGWQALSSDLPTVATQMPAPVEREWRREDGGAVPVMTGSARLEGQDRVITYGLDITDRKRAEREREELLARERIARQQNERLAAELEAAVRARDEFLSIASHELRTPLTPLQLKLGRMAREASETSDGSGLVPVARFARDMRMAERQVQRLTHLVSDLLDVARISSGRLVLNREEVDLTELARSVVDSFAEHAKQLGSPLELVTNGSGPLCGQWDRLRVEQVLTNLVSNALKYGRGGRVQVEVFAEEGRAGMRVVDEGIGIEPGKDRLIFDRFGRAVSERNYGGLGLGLYLAREIVDAHGGEISVTSELGKGSTFVVWLPRAS